MSVIFAHWPAMYSKLIEIRERQFTGTLSCVCHGAIKDIFFSKGCPVGTSSHLLDDRLGEVMYRRGMLTLDNFLDTSSRVSKHTRFGEILVESGHFTYMDLWHFLNVQSREVILSLMSAERVDIQEIPSARFKGSPLPVGFDGPLFWESLREMSYHLWSFENYAQNVDSFYVNPLAKDYLRLSDYQNEFCQLVQKNPTYSSLVHIGSRLKPFYTVRTLCELFCMGLILSQKGGASLPWFTPSPPISHFSKAFDHALELASRVAPDKVGFYIRMGNRWLSRILGPGCYVKANGFQLDTIMAQWRLLKAESEFHFSSQAFSTPCEEKLYKHMALLLLFLAFELTNAQCKDEELKPLHHAVEALSPSTVYLL